MLKHLVITLILMGFALPALADDTENANELFVEAVQLLQSAEGTTNAAERLRLSEEALGNLTEIVDRYPTTDLAVKLISGQAIGNISLESVAEAIGKACLASPNYACAIAQALAIVEAIENPLNIAVLGLIASSQAEVGEVEGARGTIAKALTFAKKDPMMGSLVHAFLATAYAELGDMENARNSLAQFLAFFETAQGTEAHYFVLPLAATAQAKVGDIKEAKKAIAEFLAYAKTESGEDRYGLLTLIASAQAEVGDIEGAKESIAEVLATEAFEGDARTMMLVVISTAQAEVGDIKGAKESIAQALAGIETVEMDDTDRALFLANLARALAKME